MPQIFVKLFASLRNFMPEHTSKGQATLDLTNDNTVMSVLADLNVPEEHCHLVLINGVFIPPEERGAQRFAEGDTLAVWPPVAGG